MLKLEEIYNETFTIINDIVNFEQLALVFKI